MSDWVLILKSTYGTHANGFLLMEPMLTGSTEEQWRGVGGKYKRQGGDKDSSIPQQNLGVYWPVLQQGVLVRQWEESGVHFLKVLLVLKPLEKRK